VPSKEVLEEAEKHVDDKKEDAADKSLESKEQLGDYVSDCVIGECGEIVFFHSQPHSFFSYRF
jgi:hypothetical protein